MALHDSVPGGRDEGEHVVIGGVSRAVGNPAENDVTHRRDCYLIPVDRKV